jgi:DNA-binding winged helix-turn-helix (wHTH) protein
MSSRDSRETFRFGDFELDVTAYELRHKGRAVRLERQPMDLLILLVERRGVLVSRTEIVDRLWGKDVFVDVETGVHTAIRKIRQALRDPREAPNFIETVPGKGYRFVAAAEVVSGAPEPRSATMPLAAGPPAVHDQTSVVTETARHDQSSVHVAAASSTVDALPIPTEPQSRLRKAPHRVLALAVLARVVVGGWLIWTRLNTGSTTARATLGAEGSRQR